jgi:hypothetical protein
MKSAQNDYRNVLVLLVGITYAGLACQKTTTAPTVSGVSALTVVDAIPNSVYNLVPVINTSSAIMWFQNANSIGYGGFWEYSPVSGSDTVYVLQSDDTLNVGPKTAGLMFYNILPLKKGGIYSLFLCGADTTSPDYLFTADTLPYHNPIDSTFGVRFINLSAGSNPISVDIMGNPNGSEVGSLSYKGITSFREYTASSSSPSSYTFEFRDATLGGLLSSYTLSGILNGIGANARANNYRFRNFTVALIGQPGVNAEVQQSAILVNNY